MRARNSSGTGPVVGHGLGENPDRRARRANPLGEIEDLDRDPSWCGTSTSPTPSASNVYRYDLQINLDGEEWQDSWFLLATPGPGDRGSRTGAGYRDTSVEVGRTVWYRIRAVASNGNSSWSNVVKVTTPKGPPGPPGDVRAEASGSKAIKLTWSEPYRDGGSRVTRYQIRVSEDPKLMASGWNILNMDRSHCRDDDDPDGLYCEYLHAKHPPHNPWEDEPTPALGIGDTWHYQIRAANHVGWGAWSDWMSATVE